MIVGNVCVANDLVIELRGYFDERGTKRFADWLEGLDPIAAAKITMTLARMELGNLANSFESISEKMVTGSSSCSVAAPRGANRKISKFRLALLREAVESILNGELDAGKSVLRDYVNATVGFQDLRRTRPFRQRA